MYYICTTVNHTWGGRPCGRGAAGIVALACLLCSTLASGAVRAESPSQGSAVSPRTQSIQAGLASTLVTLRELKKGELDQASLLSSGTEVITAARVQSIHAGLASTLETLHGAKENHAGKAVADLGPPLGETPANESAADAHDGPDIELNRTGLASTLSIMNELKPNLAEPAGTGRQSLATNSNTTAEETGPLPLTIEPDGKLSNIEVEVLRLKLASTLSALQREKGPRPAAPSVEGNGVFAKPFEMEYRPINSVSTDIAYSEGELPLDLARTRFLEMGDTPTPGAASRDWVGSLYQWEAPSLCHQPLYFEELNLERFGYRQPRCRFTQALVSGARFFATVPALPYMMAAKPPRECIYTLGHYRPGSCVPFQVQLIELQPKAGAVEGAAIAGLILAIP